MFAIRAGCGRGRSARFITTVMSRLASMPRSARIRWAAQCSCRAIANSRQGVPASVRCSARASFCARDSSRRSSGASRSSMRQLHPPGRSTAARTATATWSASNPVSRRIACTCASPVSARSRCALPTRAAPHASASRRACSITRSAAGVQRFRLMLTLPFRLCLYGRISLFQAFYTSSPGARDF